MPADVDVFVMPNDWTFVQFDLGFGDENSGMHVTVAGEPYGSVSEPTITLDVFRKADNVTLYLNAGEALEIWSALGCAIKNATGKEPVPDPAQVKSMRR